MNATIFQIDDSFNNQPWFHVIFYLCEKCDIFKNEKYLEKLKNIILENGIIYFLKLDNDILQKIILIYLF